MNVYSNISFFVINECIFKYLFWIMNDFLSIQISLFVAGVHRIKF